MAAERSQLPGPNGLIQLLDRLASPGFDPAGAGEPGVKFLPTKYRIRGTTVAHSPSYFRAFGQENSTSLTNGLPGRG
jgi:hypothetical protein